MKPSILLEILDIILPPRCIVTGDIVERQGMISAQGFAGLYFIGFPHCSCCGVPFEFEVEGTAQCAECLKEPPGYETARSALKYNDRSRDVILGFKHADKTHAVTAFAPWLKRAGEGMLGQADFIVPVPLHRWRLLSRRYNQAALMAFALARETGVKCLPDALARVRATPSQGHMDRKDRADNVRKAFAFNMRYAGQVKGKTIVLVDDVYTTGSTVKECAKVLLGAGAAKVHVLTLARVANSAG